MSRVATSKDFVILCVCAGNIHRSALAEALMEKWAHWYLPEGAAARVAVGSAGLIAEPGVPMGARAREIAIAFGADDRPRVAATLTDDLVASADLVLTATRRQAEEVVRRVPAALRTTFTMREAGRAADHLPDRPGSPATPGDLRAIVARMADSRSGVTDDDDVMDPQGRGDDAYVLMVQQEVPALAALAHVLFGMTEPDLDAYARAAHDPGALLERSRGAVE